jgi:hypothetical protein
VQDHRAEAADRPLFDGDKGAVVAPELADERAVERLGKAGVGDGDREPLRGDERRGAPAFVQMRPEGQKGDVAALCDDAAAADLERGAAVGQGQAFALA